MDAKSIVLDAMKEMIEKVSAVTGGMKTLVLVEDAINAYGTRTTDPLLVPNKNY